MSRLNLTRTYEQDETLSKLETALEDATGVDMRSAIQGAIEDRKQEIRQSSLAVSGE